MIFLKHIEIFFIFTTHKIMIENDIVLAIKNLRRKRQKIHVCIYLYSLPVILVIEICVDKTVEQVER